MQQPPKKGFRASRQQTQPNARSTVTSRGEPLDEPLREKKKDKGAEKGKAKKSSSRTATVVLSIVGLAALAWSFRCEIVVAHAALTVPPPTYVDEPVHSLQYNNTMLWGSYRPHLYFGMRTRSHAPVLTGLAWRDVHGRVPVRHTAEESSEVGFIWAQHDGRRYGLQTIRDNRTRANIDIHMLKRPHTKHGGDWVNRISGTSGLTIQLIYYFSVAKHGSLDIVQGPKGQLLVRGKNPDTEGFTALISTLGVGGEDLNFTLALKPGEQWDVPFDRLSLRNSRGKGRSNFAAVAAHVKGPFRLDVVLLSHHAHPSLSGLDGEELFKAVNEIATADGLLGCAADVQFKLHSLAFTTRFEKIFNLTGKGYGRKLIESNYQTMAMSSLSNYLGGIGYWYGSSFQLGPGGVPFETKPAELFSGVPSRAKFPRGFLWDEGFHQLLVAKWDSEISKDIILNWLSLMEEDGYIAREQIRGAEPRTRVPREFVPQNPIVANPPTLALQIQNFAQQNKDGSHTAFLLRAWPLLERWFKWFVRTQTGAHENTFRWRGRSGFHTLPSGLDDYPRSICPTKSELNVDLHSWVALMASTMQNIAISVKQDPAAYRTLYTTLEKKLEHTHWDGKHGQYADVSGCAATKEPKHLNHTGYVNLFPILTGVAANHERVSRTLRHAKEKGLFTPYGIRSLSSLDLPFIPQHENYWTGPIWINLNFMFLRSLKYNYPQFEEEYNLVREAVVENVAKRFKETGKLWENYHPSTGEGQGTAPFTGWTALVVLIMSEQY